MTFFESLVRVLDFGAEKLRRDFCFQIEVSCFKNLLRFGFRISKLASSFENVTTLLPTKFCIFVVSSPGFENWTGRKFKTLVSLFNTLRETAKMDTGTLAVNTATTLTLCGITYVVLNKKIGNVTEKFQNALDSVSTNDKLVLELQKTVTENQALLKTQAEEIAKLRTVLSNHDRFILDLARYAKYPPVVGGQAPPPVVDGTRENPLPQSSGSENPATVATPTSAAVADKIPASTEVKTKVETKKPEAPAPKTKTFGPPKGPGSQREPEKAAPAPAKKVAAKKSAPKKVASEDESSLSESEDELPPNVEAELQAALAAEIKNLDRAPEPKSRPEVKKTAPTRTAPRTRAAEVSSAETSSDSDPSSVESDRSTSSREATSRRRPRQATKPDTIEITSRVAPSPRPTRAEVSHQAQPPRRWGPAPAVSRGEAEAEKKKKVWGEPEEGRSRVVRKRMLNGKVLPPGSYPV